LDDSREKPSSRRGLGSIRKLREAWRPYREAVLGFRNHWYPVCFARDLDGDTPIMIKVLGENLVLRRVEGKIYAVEDRCSHRRVPLTHMYKKGIGEKIECYTKDTITCWYHGFTYSFIDGSLVSVLTWPSCDLIGKVRIKTYPVREERGLVFVFVGDTAPPDLADDLAPGLLDADQVIEGRKLLVRANWRWGVENGFDSTHIYMHRNSILFENAKSIVPLGLMPSDNYKVERRTGPGPKGVIENTMDDYEPIWEANIGDPERGGAVVQARTDISEDMTPLGPMLSIWLPCLLSVDGFPLPGERVLEFYVPIDETSHMYFQLMTKKIATPAEETAFRNEVRTRWRKYVQDGFNGDDVAAREGLEDAYTKGNGWLDEHLTYQDMCILEWRNLASEYNRGIQKPAGVAEP